MIFIKYCKKCKRAFDIETNYNLCAECRKEKKEKKYIGDKNG